jgi:hypothetical protein
MICAFIVLGPNKFSNNSEVIIYAVATGFSMIPAFLIVVLTITMAAGTNRMVECNVVVRKLNSLESLGAVTGKLSRRLSLLTDFGTDGDRHLLGQNWNSYAGQDGRQKSLGAIPGNLFSDTHRQPYRPNRW